MSENNSMDEFLESVLKRCEAATPGPWCFKGDVLGNKYHGSDWASSPGIYLDPAVEQDGKNISFAAAARTDLPRLARYAQKLRAVLKRIATTGDPEDDVDVAREALNLSLEDL